MVTNETLVKVKEKSPGPSFNYNNVCDPCKHILHDAKQPLSEILRPEDEEVSAHLLILGKNTEHSATHDSIRQHKIIPVSSLS